MNINDMYPSAFLKASDLQGRAIKVKIKDCSFQTMGDETKPVLSFHGKDKEMVLNKTNSMALASAFGPETESWKGKEIELFSMKVQFQGQLVDGLRVRPIAPANDVQAPPAAKAPASEPLNDDIPF